MIYITQNTFIDLININKGYRSNPSAQEDQVTLKHAPELQTIRCTKSGPKHHACKEKHACKDIKKTWSPQSSPYAALDSVAFLSHLYRNPEHFGSQECSRLQASLFGPVLLVRSGFPEVTMRLNSAGAKIKDTAMPVPVRAERMSALWRWTPSWIKNYL